MAFDYLRESASEGMANLASMLACLRMIMLFHDPQCKR